MSATTLAKKAKSSFPTHLRYQDELHDAFTHANDVGMRSDIQKLTSYYNRHYRSPTGRASQKWLQEQVEGLASKLPAKTTVTEFEHAWPQNSILLHIQGTNTTLTKERGVTILGAHQDSTNLFGWLPAPGADDDGSGTVTLLETLRALGKAGWAPQSDVEFHWYSAEEGGLIGSQAVVQSYVEKEAHVQAMLQMDMTAFLKEGTEERIGVVTDFVSPALTRYVENLIESYIGLPIGESKMKYGASDHASWDRYGFPSAFVMEAYVCVILTSLDRLKTAIYVVFTYVNDFLTPDNARRVYSARILLLTHASVCPTVHGVCRRIKWLGVDACHLKKKKKTCHSPTLR